MQLDGSAQTQGGVSSLEGRRVAAAGVLIDNKISQRLPSIATYIESATNVHQCGLDLKLEDLKCYYLIPLNT